MKRLTVYAAQVRQAADLFEREGVVVVKSLLPWDAVELVADFLDGKEADRLGQFSLGARLGKRMLSIPRALAKDAILHEILGAERLFLHMPPMARMVTPENKAAAVPLHQDMSYNEHLFDFLTLWVPLVPIDEACGGIAVYPGSHRLLPNPPLGPAVANDWRPALDPPAGLERVMLAPLRLGDVVVLHPKVMHESMPNRSDHVRLSCDYRFFGDGSTSSKHYLDLAEDRLVEPVHV